MKKLLLTSLLTGVVTTSIALGAVSFTGNETLNSIKEKALAMSAELNVFKGNEDKLVEKIEKYQQKITDLKNQIAAGDSNAVELNRRIEELEAEIESLEAQLQEQTSLIEEINRLNSELEGANNAVEQLGETVLGIEYSKAMTTEELNQLLGEELNDELPEEEEEEPVKQTEFTWDGSSVLETEDFKLYNASGNVQLKNLNSNDINVKSTLSTGNPQTHTIKSGKEIGIGYTISMKQIEITLNDGTIINIQKQ